MVGDRNDNPLVFKTFDRAVKANPDAHPLYHSDRGFQYTNRTFLHKLEKAGIVCLINDAEAAGITLDERRVRSIYNPEIEATNYFYKARERYFVDDTQNAVVFTIE